jgi:hypothetical protein
MRRFGMAQVFTRVTQLVLFRSGVVLVVLILLVDPLSAYRCATLG